MNLLNKCLNVWSLTLAYDENSVEKEEFTLYDSYFPKWEVANKKTYKLLKLIIFLWEKFIIISCCNAFSVQ